MASTFECESPAEISDIASKDVSRIVGVIAKTLAANSPYLNLLNGGTFPAGVSDEQRSVIQQQAAPGDSLATPTFVCETDLCGVMGAQALTGTIDYAYRLEGFRERGPRVCVKKGYAAFESSYTRAEDSLRKLITQYINADIRAQLESRSASKFTAAAGYDFNSLFAGGNPTDIGVNFAGKILPTGPMTFKALHYVLRYLKEVLFAEDFSDSKGMSHARFIGGADQVEFFRNEVGVEHVMCCLTQGSYRLGEVALTAYSFETAPAYRGLAWAVDQRPRRATGFNVDGTLNIVDPVVIVTNACKNTAYAKANPAWVNAPYEIGNLVFANSFERQVPERYVGEGSFKFAPQLHMGELEWHYMVDNGCNFWGDYGQHKFQITRAYKPVRPEHVVPILYKRCNADLGLVNCDETSSTLFSGADTFTNVGVCDETDCPALAGECV